MLETLIVVAMTSLGMPEASVGNSADEAGVRANVAAFEAAWNKRDVAGVLATYAPDADFVFFDGPLIAGRDALRTSLETSMSTASPTMRITLTVTNVRFPGRDVAIADTIARFNEGDVRENRGTSVLVRQDGRWLVVALRVFPARRP